MLGVPPYRKEMILLEFWRREEGTDFEEASVPSASPARNSSIEEKRGQVIDLHEFIGLRPCKDLLKLVTILN
jgi:hypothetical protein